MLRQSLFALSLLLASELAAQTVVFTPTSTIFNPAGGNLTFNATVVYSTPPSVLAFSANLPSGWTYVATAGTNVPDVTPTVGSTSTPTNPFSWTYLTTPASPVTFNFTVTYPAAVTGVQPLASSILTRNTTGSPAVPTTGPAFSLTVPGNTAVWGGATGNWTNSALWSPATVPNNGTPANSTYAASISSGNVTVDSPITINDLVFLGGTIKGVNSLTIVGSGSDWEAGVFSGLSQLAIASGAFLTASGNSNHDFGGSAITNNGQFIWNGNGDLRSGTVGGNNGSFVNASGATFTDASTAGTSRITNTGIGGTFSFTNQGTYLKTGTNETKIEIPFTNQGPIIVNAGNLHFDTTFTQLSGGSILVAGVGTGNLTATATFDNPLNLAAGSLSGSGSVSGDVISSATISPGASLGQLTITGNLTLLSTSQLLIDLGGTTQGTSYDFISVGGTAALGGTLSLSLANNFSSSILTSNTFTVLTASSLTGTFTNAANNNRLIDSGGIGSFLVTYTATSVNLSNFQFTPVPEPSTWALLTTGLATLGVGAWRRRGAKR